MKQYIELVHYYIVITLAWIIYTIYGHENYKKLVKKLTNLYGE